MNFLLFKSVSACFKKEFPGTKRKVSVKEKVFLDASISCNTYYVVFMAEEYHLILKEIHLDNFQNTELDFLG